MQITIRIGEFDVHARLHRQFACLLFVFSDGMAVCVRTITQFPNRVIIRNDKALETPFLSQHIAQQPLVRVRRHAVNLVVARHHADGAGLLNRTFERRQKSFAQQTHRGVRRRAIHAGLRLAVRREMFERGDDALFVVKRSVALKSPRRCNSQLCDQIRVFAESFLDAPPTRVSRHVHHRRERLMRAARPRFLGGHRAK